MQITATIKRRITDSRYAVGNCDTCKSTATRERPRTYNFCLTVDCTTCNRRIFCFYQYYIRVTGVSEIICVIIFVILQTAATIKRMITDSRHAVGDCDTFKSTATRERLSPDTRYAVADCYAFKRIAILERRITDRHYTVGNGYTCKTTAIIERQTTDTRYRFAVIFGGNHNIRNIPGYPCYGITFAIIIQGVFQLWFLTAYSAVAVLKVVFGISDFFFTTCHDTGAPMVRFIFFPSLRPNMRVRLSANAVAVLKVVFGISVFFFTTCYGTVMPMVCFIACPRCGIGMRMRRLIIAAVTAVVSCTAVIVVAVVASNKPERAG